MPKSVARPTRNKALVFGSGTAGTGSGTAGINDRDQSVPDTELTV
jgi:hypothetical protein